MAMETVALGGTERNVNRIFSRVSRSRAAHALFMRPARVNRRLEKEDVIDDMRPGMTHRKPAFI